MRYQDIINHTTTIDETVQNRTSWLSNSKVVDNSGHPIRMYHATTADFDSFDVNAGGRGGVYLSFTPKGAVSGSIAGVWDNGKKSQGNMRLIPVYVNATRINGLDLSKQDQEWFDSLPDIMTGVDEQKLLDNTTNPIHKMIIIYLYDDLHGEQGEILRKKSKLPTLQDVVTRQRTLFYNHFPSYTASVTDDKKNINDLRRQGFDSTLVNDEAGVSLVVFNANQIKSIFNNGGWSPQSDNISENVSTPSDMIKLYRGDGNKFDVYDVGKTDENALFGPGIYLTSSPKVAKDYTSNTDDIVFSGRTIRNKHIASDRSEIINLWVRKELTNKINKIKSEYNTQYNNKMSTVFVKYGFDKNKYKELTDDENDQYIKDITKLEDDLKKTFKKNVNIEIKLFINDLKNRKKDYRIIKRTQGYYDIVQNTSNSNISTYLLPISYVNKTIDADAPMNLGIISIIRDILVNDFGMIGKLNLSLEQDGNNNYSFNDWIEKVKDIPARPYLGNEAFGGNGEYPSLYQFLHDTGPGITMMNNPALFWERFIHYMTNKGNVGIRFNGNHGTSGIKQKSYVFWDADFISKSKTMLKKPRLNHISINDIDYSEIKELIDN